MDRITLTVEKEETIKVLSPSSAHLATLVTFGKLLVNQTINSRKKIIILRGLLGQANLFGRGN